MQIWRNSILREEQKKQKLHPTARFVPQYVITFASEKGCEIPSLS